MPNLQIEMKKVVFLFSLCFALYIYPCECFICILVGINMGTQNRAI